MTRQDTIAAGKKEYLHQGDRPGSTTSVQGQNKSDPQETDEQYQETYKEGRSQQFETASEERKCPEGSVFRQMLQQLNLVNKYPGQISIQDVMAVNYNEVKHVESRRFVLADIPWMMLKRIISAHSECRDITLPDEQNIENSTELDPTTPFISCIPGEIQNISPLDVFTIVFQCCDPLLKQLVFKKLYLCKIAVPFLYKHWETETKQHLIIPIWPLRSLIIENKVMNSSSNSNENNVLELPTKMLAFARFGRPRYSKSKLLNSLLSDQGCKTFFNIDCPAGMTPRHISNGQVEMFWLPTLGDKRDKFQDAMTFLNIRGDIKENFNVDILAFIANLVDSFVIFIDIDSLLHQTENVKDIILKFSSVMLIVANPITAEAGEVVRCFQYDVAASGTGLHLLLLSTHVGVIEQNVVEMTNTMSKRITSLLNSKDTRSYQDRLHFAKSSIVKTDEEESNCQKGKDEAEKLVKEMKSGSQPIHWKYILTPVHSMYSQQLGQLIKGREREKHFTKCELIDREIKNIRENQTQAITETVTLFVNILIRNGQNPLKLHFFLHWLHFYIEREKRLILPSLMQETRCAWEELKVLKCRDIQTEDEIDDQKRKITQLEIKIDEASFSVEHFFRETGLIYDAILELNEDASKFGLPPLNQIANIMGRLVADGHQLELIDGESFYMPYMWTKKVLQEVDKCIAHSKVMTLSVLGLQSSGKSTLLNIMFGSQFSTRSGRCTRGLHLQLIPTTDDPTSDITSPFRYVLIVDTEGLRSPESSHVEKAPHEHDNELATVITGVGDVTMLNIMGENASEMGDKLEIIVHAFLRLKMANKNLDLKKSCAFIHQNVMDTAASENMISGLCKLMQTLDDMTKGSANTEGILEITTFNQVIEFDINSQVWYLQNLWQGNPPMARVNNEYSEHVVDTRCKILQKASTMKEKSYKSLNDILVQAYSLWKGVLNEDFVFSFRNSLEIKAYMEMETFVQEQLWHLESCIRDKLLGVSQNTFAVCGQNDNLRNVADNLINDLNDMLFVEQSETENKIQTYFDDNKYKDIIVQWKTGQQRQIENLSHKLEQITRERIEKSLGKRSVEITVSSHESHEKELRNASIEIANKNKGLELTEKQINELFEGIWSSFSTKVDAASHSSERNRRNMNTVFETCLRIFFKRNNALLKDALIQSLNLSPLPNLKKLAGSFVYTRVDIKDISFKSTKETEDYTSSVIEYVEKRVNEIFEAIDEKIKKHCQVNDEITEMSVNELIHELDTSLRDILTGKSKYDFTIRFYVKLHVHVSRYAHPVFQMHNDTYFKTQDISARLELYKQQQKIRFEALLSNRKSEVIVAKLFSHVIESFAEEWTSQNLPNKVTDELHSELPSVKNRVIIQICTNLLDKDNFLDFVRYLQSPDQFASLWITEKANYHLFAKDSGAYARTAKSLVNAVFGNVKNCISSIKANCTGKPPPTMEKWINDVHIYLKAKNFSIPPERFRNVKNELKRIENVDYLTNEILINLTKSQEKINYKFSQHRSDSVKWADTYNPIERIKNKIWGCPEQCAFCGEPCAKNENHVGSAHYSIQHRPSCCKGIQFDQTELACLESCEFGIQSKRTHECGDFNYICNNGTREKCGKTHYYRDYKIYLPEWDIAPTSSMHNTSKFWMWFVATYKDDLQNYYRYKIEHVPSSWDEISKDQAKESLQKIYSA